MKMTACFNSEKRTEVNLHIVDEKEMELMKQISVAEFMSMMNACRSSYDYYHVGKLPGGFWDGCFHMEDPSTFQMVLTIDGGMRPMVYHGENLRVPFPNLVCYVSSDRGKLVETQLFAVRDMVVTEHSVLFNYPYGNVYRDGNICWGGNCLEKVGCPWDIERLIALFFGSETNNDLFHSPVYRTQEELVKKVLKRKVFPQKWMEPSPYVESVKDLIERFKKRD